MTVFGTLICETVVSETDSGVVISFTDEKEFIFSTGDKKKRLTAWNIGRVKSPDAVFYIQKTSETVERPEKAIEVVKLLEEISKVLIEYGVDERCLRLR